MSDELAARAKSTAAGVLSLLASGLQVAAHTAETAADHLRANTGPAAPPSPPAPEGGEAGPRRTPTVESAPAATEPAARPPTIVADLADRPAREVIAEVDRMPTDELRRLLEHERTGKQRKSVIAAIERAVDAHQPG